MATAKLGGEAKQQKLPPKGTADVRLFGIYELGTQKDQYGEKFKILFRFELIGTSEVFKEGSPPEPFAVKKDFNLTLGTGGGKKSGLLIFLEKWLGNDFNSFVKDGVFNFNALLNRPGEAMISHRKAKNELFYPDLLEVGPLSPGKKLPACKNKLIAFNIGEDGVMIGENPEKGGKRDFMNFDWHDTYMELHKSFQDKIALSPEFQAAIKLKDGNTSETVDDLVDAPVGEMPVDEEDPF